MGAKKLKQSKVVICQVPGCQNQAKYALYKTFSDGKKKWLQVCDAHDKEIGSENIKRAKSMNGEY